MLQGRGVTKYAADAPSYDFTASTTEFDDELMKRGIVTHEQVLLAKGASADVVQELLSTKEAPIVGNAQVSPGEDSADDDSCMASEGEEEVMRSFRRKRNEEHCNSTWQRFGEAIRINRAEWLEHVNEASQHHWVVVCLASAPCVTARLEACIQLLARESTKVKFVIIEAKQVFSHDWPEENLPTLFLYRHGKLQQQLLSLSKSMDPSELEALLEERGVQ